MTLLLQISKINIQLEVLSFYMLQLLRLPLLWSYFIPYSLWNWWNGLPRIRISRLGIIPFLGPIQGFLIEMFSLIDFNNPCCKYSELFVDFEALEVPLKCWLQEILLKIRVAHFHHDLCVLWLKLQILIIPILCVKVVFLSQKCQCY